MFAPPKHLRKNVGRRVWADPFVLGNQQARKGQHEAAVQQFSRLIDRGVRQDAAVFASRGSSAQALGDHVRAVYDYSMAIRLQPDEPSHYTSRAISLVALHQLETMPGALHDHDKAVALVTGSGAAAALVTPATVAGVYLARGLARETAGRYAESVDDLCHVLGALGAPRGEGDEYDASTTLLASAAEVTGALLRRGMCLRRLGRYDLSLRDLRDVVERSPELAMAHEQLGLCLRERDDESATPPDAEAAEAALATAVRLRPKDANLRVEHARALGALGRLEPAADALAEALQMAPSEPSVSLTYADHLRHVAAEATVPYKQPLAYDAAAGAYALAERVAGLRRDAALERVERLQAAAAKARRAGQPLSLIAQADLADASATAKAMAGLAAAAAHGGGQCYAAQQLWPDAHARYSAALKLCPDKAESRLELATTLYAQGAPRQALVELDVCVTMRPSWAAPRRLRGELHREGGALRLALADFTAALEARDPGPEAPATARRRGAAVSPGDDYVRRGGVSMLLGDPAAALDDFEAAAKAGVPAGVVTVRLQTARAAALRALGRRRRALRLLGIALRHGAEHIVSPYEPTPQEMEERSKPKPKVTAIVSDDEEDVDDDDDGGGGGGSGSGSGSGGRRRKGTPEEKAEAAAAVMYQEARRAAEQLEQNALFAAVHVLRGQCLHERRQYAAAVRAYDHALRRAPNDANTRCLRAASHYRAGNLPAALSDARSALAAPSLLPAAPSDASLRADMQQLLGMLLARSEHLWGAVAALSASIHLHQDADGESLYASKSMATGGRGAKGEEADDDEAGGASLARSASVKSRPSAPSHRPAPALAPKDTKLGGSHRAAPALVVVIPSRPSAAAPAAAPEAALVHARTAPALLGGASEARRKAKEEAAREEAAKEASAKAAALPPSGHAYALLQRGITLLLCERAEAAVADLSSALEHKAGWAYAHYARGFAHKACDDLDRAAADFEASRRANGGLRVDYDVVFHVQAGLEMLFDEAGWDPLPSVLTMMSTEDARREEEEPEVPEEEGEEGAEEELEEATAPPTGEDEAYLVDSSAAPPTWHPPPTEWRGRGRVRDVATAEEDEEDEEDQ